MVWEVIIHNLKVDKMYLVGIFTTSEEAGYVVELWNKKYQTAEKWADFIGVITDDRYILNCDCD